MLSDQDRTGVNQIVTWLKDCRRLLFITGAGISADSGLPTYRGIGGLYNETHTDEGVPIEVALSGDMMRQRPELTWKYLGQIEAACRGARHNRSHKVIAAMEKNFDVWVLTQNVDGFHHAAGSTQVIDIHGDLHNLKCVACSYRQTVTDYAEISLPPVCPVCRAYLRPNVVLFGEILPVDKLQTLYDQCRQGFDMVLSIGTTSVFPYIAEPVLLARQNRIPTVEINPGATQVSDAVDLKITTGAAETLEFLAKKIGLDDSTA